MNKIALKRALEMLQNHMLYFLEMFDEDLEWPVIGHGPDNKETVDIYWKENEYDLLVNVPEEGEATYYGDCDSGGEEKFVIRGSFDPSTINQEFLALWINL